jgi:hypothetical protein
MRTTRVGLSALALSVVALAADPFVGTWKMNPAKSTDPPKVESLIFRIQASENGLTLDEEMMVDGKVTKTLWPHVFDGKDYPHATKTADTVAARRTDSHRFEVVFKKNGNIVARGTWEVSADGWVLTYSVDRVDAEGKATKRVLIYERQ